MRRFLAECLDRAGDWIDRSGRQAAGILYRGADCLDPPDLSAADVVATLRELGYYK